MPAELELDESTTAATVSPPGSAAAAHGARRRILGNAIWSAADFWFQQASQFFTFVVAVRPSSHGLGIYSLVCYFLVQRMLEAAMLIIVSGKRPGLQVTRAALAEIVDYGKHRAGNNVTYTVYLQVPRVLIGALAGA